MRTATRILLGVSLLACAVARSTVGAQEAKRPIRIAVDLREAPKRIFHARMEIPAAAGPLTLVYPKWIPGDHAPTGPVVDVAGLHFRAGGKEISWRRDGVDLYSFHCDVPTGVETLEVALDYLAPQESGTAGAPSSSAQVAVLPWNLVVLYPQGAKTDAVTFSPALRLPTGWKFATALEQTGKSGEEIEFESVTLTTLVDSPVLAGANLQTYDLSPGQRPGHRIQIAADSAMATQVTPEELQHLRQLVAESGELFGARHYRHYDFLLALSDHLVPGGLEHHESSDNRAPEKMLLDPKILETQMDLLPHEFLHSWNGKYRRPAGLATPDFQEPMKGELLWVYEGLTQYYGVMLAARSGFWTPEILRDAIRRAKKSQDPIELLLENEEFFLTVRVDYRGGERYPHLERTAAEPDLLSEMGRPKAPQIPFGKE